MPLPPLYETFMTMPVGSALTQQQAYDATKLGFIVQISLPKPIRWSTIEQDSNFAKGFMPIESYIYRLGDPTRSLTSPAKTDRDQDRFDRYAAAALQGLLSNSTNYLPELHTVSGYVVTYARAAMDAVDEHLSRHKP